MDSKLTVIQAKLESFEQMQLLGVEAAVEIRSLIAPYIQNVIQAGLIINNKEAKVVFEGSSWNNKFWDFHMFDVSLQPNELANYLSIGEVELKENNELDDNAILISISKSTLPVCARCRRRTLMGWPYVSDIGHHPIHKDLCIRCAAAMP